MGKPRTLPFSLPPDNSSAPVPTATKLLWADQQRIYGTEVLQLSFGALHEQAAKEVWNEERLQQVIAVFPPPDDFREVRHDQRGVAGGLGGVRSSLGPESGAANGPRVEMSGGVQAAGCNVSPWARMRLY